MTSPTTEEALNRILRAVRQRTAAKTANGFEPGKPVIQNDLLRLPYQSKPIRENVLDRIGGKAICSNTWYHLRNGSPQVIATSRRLLKSG
jgi:hypothetical protein